MIYTSGSTLSFDISGLEILLPLVTGARLVMAPARSGGDTESLLPLLAEVTVAQATPVTWKLLALREAMNLADSGRPVF